MFVLAAWNAVLSSPSPDRAPEVLKIEPPNWWAGHSLNPIRLLIRGRRLADAQVAASGAGLKMGQASVNAAGTFLFVDITIDPEATPGERTLEIVTPQGKTTTSFELSQTLVRAGRFQGFSPDDIIYLLTPDRFSNGDPTNDDPPVSRGLLDRTKSRYYHGGDLQGIIHRLPYLKELGVTAIWMNPIYDNVNRLSRGERFDQEAFTDYHGYGAVDFYAVEERFGDLAKLRELVDAAHRHGIKIIQDQVANHTGPEHPWVQDPPTPTWFNGTRPTHLSNTWQTWTLMDPHAAPELQKATLEGWFADILPDLNQNDEEVRRYLIQNTLWWAGMAGLDGIRQDTLPYVPRRFWQGWMAAIKKEYPRLAVVGEVLDSDPALVSSFQGGRVRFDGVDTGVDTLFDYPLYYPLLRAFAEGKPLRDVAVLFGHDSLYERPDLLVTFLGTHDVPRFMNLPTSTTLGLKLGFTLIMTARGIPLIYYGDEIALRGGDDPENRREFPGGWPGDPRNAFEESDRTPEEQAVFERVRKLTRLRRRLEPLRRGSMLTLSVSEQTFVYARATKEDTVVVVFNNDTEPAKVDFSVTDLPLSEGSILEDQLGDAPALQVHRDRVRVDFPARAGGVYTVRKMKSDRRNSPA